MSETKKYILKNLNKVIRTIDDKDFTLTKSDGQIVLDIWTPKRVLVLILGNTKQEGENSIRAYDLATQIFKAESEIELSAADFSFIKDLLWKTDILPVKLKAPVQKLFL